MPALVFEGNALGPAVSVEVRAGGRIVDACDAAHAPVGFSCRSARCATCLVEVLEGAELLEPPEAAEQEMLTLLAAPPSRRLACQAAARPAPGLVRLRWVGAL